MVGVEYCYNASANAFFSCIELNTYTHTNGSGTRTLEFSDDTDRTDEACRYYVLPSPVTLTVESGVNAFIEIVWNSANSSFVLGRTTFVFQSTGTTATLPTFVPDENMTIFKEGTTNNVTDSPRVP